MNNSNITIYIGLFTSKTLQHLPFHVHKTLLSTETALSNMLKVHHEVFHVGCNFLCHLACFYNFIVLKKKQASVEGYSKHLKIVWRKLYKDLEDLVLTWSVWEIKLSCEDNRTGTGPKVPDTDGIWTWPRHNICYHWKHVPTDNTERRITITMNRNVQVYLKQFAFAYPSTIVL